MAGDGQGEYSLRSEIADYLHHARGVNCRPENIVLGAGNEYLEILLTQLLGGNKTVLMENPGYPQAYHTFRNMGYRVVTVPADEQGLSGGTVRAAAAGACLHDAVPSVPDRQRHASWAEDWNFLRGRRSRRSAI